MSEEERTPIELGKKDCAIIFREGADGGHDIEMYLTKPEDENATVSDITVLCAALNIRLTDADFINELMNWFDTKIMEVQENTDDEG
ncbi:MAG: hypothetical protein DRQ78_08275 [Epsilonproteobacteria bacterium]|nr:MAG: hypothetical protein DRQ78_08275 [Campylobacterota bacterium]